MSSPQWIGPYQVLRELGRGGMGVVYEVRHPELPDRRLALKTLLTASLDPEDLLRFQREAHLLAQIDHPHVVRVHQLGQQHDTLFVVLDFVDGQPLDTLLRDGPLPPQRAARLLIQLAEGVQALHDAGIVHRDLKPQNVVLRADGTPVLLDFGLAREVDGQSLTQEGAVLGTPQFMSPEQARGDEQRKLPAVDVYGLGAVLYACLSSRPPFDGGSLVSILYEVLESPPPSLEGVPAPVAEVCLKALSKEPHARYASPRHLAQALEQALTERAARPTRRLPVVAALGVGVAVAGWLSLGSAPEEDSTTTPQVEAVADASEEVENPGEDEAGWWTLEVEDPQRWAGFQEIRGEIDAPEHEAARAHLAEHPLLRFREPSTLGLAAETLRPVGGRWLDDARCVTYSLTERDLPGVSVVELASPDQPAQNLVAAQYATEPGRGVIDVAVAPNHEHFGFLTRHGDVIWVDAETLAPVEGVPTRAAPNRERDTLAAHWFPESPRALAGSDVPFRSLALGDDGRFAAGGGFQTIWSGELLGGTVRVHPRQDRVVERLAFLPDGSFVAAMRDRRSEYEFGSGELRHFALEGPRQGVVLGRSEYMESLLVLRDPVEVLAGTGLGYLQRYGADLTQRDNLTLARFTVESKAHDTGIHALAGWGRRVYSAANPDPGQTVDLRVHVWDLEREVGDEFVEALPTEMAVHSLDVSPDGTLLLVGSFDGHFEVWLCPPRS